MIKANIFIKSFWLGCAIISTSTLVYTSGVFWNVELNLMEAYKLELNQKASKLDNQLKSYKSIQESFNYEYKMLLGKYLNDNINFKDSLVAKPFSYDSDVLSYSNKEN
jgi:hypothetical protein